ncbi:dihydropteroate synthase [Pleionea litopenaei]|uniref:Dihydropteroate synthase n=1 Tax=Pleionea litopenaei TaxID=3070815 RepID=A0AA51RS00_9GAMM|nr:dihydropteroate synthase [Pleionea sp. HL-JVS1]WMS86492.1 dihydropteroate synthase [Pleionea sp. HL-JVS1]
MHSLYTRKSLQVMGILNVTPDSFSDGGHFNSRDKALAHAEEMISNGVDIIDVGGESTRPGAAEVSVQEEIDRVIPLVEALVEYAIPVSIDTSKPEVMRAAVNAGASLINDVRALQTPGALEAAVECQVPVCLMHMQGQPRTMQHAPSYQDVILDVMAFLAQRVQDCEAAGLSRALLSIDPGFGFGKSLQHNLQLLRHLSQFKQMKLPLLVGISRKTMLGEITGKSVEDRVSASVAAAVIAAYQGANIIRVHDVSETVDAMKLVDALLTLED